MGCCYLLTFPNGKVYVGITTKTAAERFASHCKCARYRERFHFALYHAIRKYGPESISVRTLSESDDWATLCRYERMFIVFYGSTRKDVGYNRTSGGDGAPDLSEDAKARGAAAHRKLWTDPEYRERMDAASRKVWADPVRRKARAELTRSQWSSPEFREKQAAAVIGGKYNEATRERMGRSSRARWTDPEYRSAVCSGFARTRLGSVADVPDYGEYAGIGSSALGFADTPLAEQIRTALCYWWPGTIIELSRCSGVARGGLSTAVGGGAVGFDAANLDRLASAVGFTLCGANPNLPFSEQCRQAARQSGMTGTAIARECGVSTSRACAWLNGQGGGLRLQRLNPLSVLLGWTLSVQSGP